MNKTSFIGKYKNNIIDLPFRVIINFPSPNPNFHSNLSEKQEKALSKVIAFMKENNFIFIDIFFKQIPPVFINPDITIGHIFLNSNLYFDNTSSQSKIDMIYRDYVSVAKKYSLDELLNDFDLVLKSIQEELKQEAEEAIKILGSLFCVKRENIELRDIKQIETWEEYSKVLNFEQFEKITYPNCVLYWNISNPSKEVLYVRKSKTFYFLNNKEYES